MTSSILHKTTFFVLFLLVTVTLGYTGVSWCEHNQEEGAGHLLMDNLTDSPFSDHGDHSSGTVQDCPGCVHVPVIDLAGQADAGSLSEVPAPMLYPLAAYFSCSMVSVPLVDPSISSTLSHEHSLPPRPQLSAIRTFVLLI